jgi:2-polyprenyl-3-methyl-5-hydroxy-6-metoxy-1,4-benzoquinol methylase
MKYRESEKYKEIKNNLKILNLGCGNSIICEEMYDEGYLNIYNMDISSVCIETMNERNKDSRP